MRAFDLLGLALIVGAAWLFSPILGLAVGGGAFILMAAVIERDAR